MHVPASLSSKTENFHVVCVAVSYKYFGQTVITLVNRANLINIIDILDTTRKLL